MDGPLEEPGRENQVTTESVGVESSLYQDQGLNLPADIKKLLKAMEERYVSKTQFFYKNAKIN